MIEINLNIELNKQRGAFNGEFDLTESVNNFYDNYVTTGNTINLSIGNNPKLGALAYVNISAGNTVNVPTTWNMVGDTMSSDNSKFNKLVILYVSDNDVTMVNSVVNAPDVLAPTFTSAPTASGVEEDSINITTSLNENGTVYGYLLPSGSTAPDTDTVIVNGQDSFVDSGSGGSLSFTGLSATTSYDVYVVAEDNVGNKQAAPTLVQVTTTDVNIITPILAANAGWYDFTNKEVGSFTSFTETLGNYSASVINGTPEYVTGSRLELIRSQNDGISLGSNFNVLNTVESGFTIYVKIQPTEIGYISYFLGHSDTPNQIIVALNGSGQLQTFTKINGGDLIINITSDSVFSGVAPYPTKNIFIDYIKSTGEIKFYVDSSSVELVKQSNNPIGNIADYVPSNTWYFGGRNQLGTFDATNDISALADHVIINPALLSQEEKQIIIDNA